MNVLMAILAGVCVVLSRVINFNLSEKIGVFQGTFFNYIVGLIFSLIVLLILGGKLNVGVATLKVIPWWAYLGGVAGVGIVALSVYLTPKISAFYLTIFIFVGQLIVGGLIDYFTLNELSIGKVVGGTIVLIGLTYNLVLDKNEVNTEEGVLEN